MTVICPICKKELKFINNIHLRKHNLTTEEFKKLYPNYNTVSDEYHNSRSIANRDSMLKLYENSSEDYLEQRYKHIGEGRKKAWDKAPEELREKQKERMIEQNKSWLNDEELKQRRYENSSKSMKKYWDNLSEEEYNERCKINKAFWDNLSEEEFLDIISKNTTNGSKKEFIINNNIYYFRSKFEANIAEYLIDNNIEYEYESFILKLDNEKYHKYHIIDFYIPKLNLIIECHSKTGIFKDSLEDIQIKKESAENNGYNYEVLWYSRNKNNYLNELDTILKIYSL